jgi:hypothetical protein
MIEIKEIIFGRSYKERKIVNVSLCSSVAKCTTFNEFIFVF